MHGDKILDFKPFIEKELKQLHNILERSPLYKLDILFSDSFPKQCSTCGKVFEKRKDYLEKTTPASAGSLLFSEYGLQEFRNCTCGTTMSIWGPDDDRRDNTHDGALKRAIFMNCLDKLTANGFGTRDLLMNALREVFQEESRKEVNHTPKDVG